MEIDTKRTAMCQYSDVVVGITNDLKTPVLHVYTSRQCANIVWSDIGRWVKAISMDRAIYLWSTEKKADHGSPHVAFAPFDIDL